MEISMGLAWSLGPESNQELVNRKQALEQCDVFSPLIKICLDRSGTLQ